ncbi:hypothetical protein GF356_12340 [candidate division GN15 bacterium]|nr:hypothetical protein [candidate division GN15 bacterium]
MKGSTVNLSRHWIALGLLVVVLVVAGSVMAAPRMDIENDSFNFGYVPQNSKITHSFWLKSTGDDTLRVVRVVPG